MLIANMLMIESIGRGNLLGRSVPRGRDRLQLRQGPAEQERLVNGQALCGIQQP